jgi:hypothetical protein
MSGGIVAFETKAKAEEFSHSVHGAVLTFEDLWNTKS